MCNEPRKKPSQCMRESTTVIALCEHADRAPSLASATTQILFRPCRTICQYPGIYRPLILAGHRQGVCLCVCVVSVYSLWPLTKTSCILTPGGEDGGHAETQVFRLHYGLTMQSNGITAICDLRAGVCNRGELSGDRRSNTFKGEERLDRTAHLSKPSLRLQTQTRTNWLRNGVNHGPFKRTTVLNTLPPSKSLLPNKGVKRRFCLPPFWGVTGGLKDTNEHENRNKVANSQ